MATYDRISRLNHWIAAVLFMAMLGFGFYLAYGGLPMSEKLPLIGKHKVMGVLLLIWGFWRVGYCIRQGFAAPVAVVPNWQEFASKASHIVLLSSVVLMPASGLMMALYSGFPTDVFGVFKIPAIDKIEGITGAVRLAHKYIAYAFTLTLGLHVAAALKHHFINKDRTLTRMLTG